jgi:glycosyltransferase involved in cell wall biosynthesis
MPTLNSEKHIEKTLKSLSQQTFKDMELIVVDAGSQDGTVEILRALCPNVNILKESGANPAVSRNVGMAYASGEYIAFCDSDDIMKPDMLSVLYDTAVKKSSDITVCDFDMMYPDRTINSFAHMEDYEFPISEGTVKDYYYRFSSAPKPNNYVWSRLYRRGFIVENNVRFADVRYSEDHLFNLSMLLKNPKIAHVGRSLYIYVQRDESAMRSHVRANDHGLIFLQSFHEALKAVSGQNPAVYEPLLAIYAYTRVKSILFYAWLSKLKNYETDRAVSTFASDHTAKKYLTICLEKNYIGDYCKIHNFPENWEKTVRQMLLACTGKGCMPDMSEVFK